MTALILSEYMGFLREDSGVSRPSRFSPAILQERRATAYAGVAAPSPNRAPGYSFPAVGPVIAFEQRPVRPTVG